jgi:CHAT domain
MHLTVLRIEPDGPDGLKRRLKVEQAAAREFKLTYGLPFELRSDQLPAWGEDGVVHKYGTALYQALTQHPGVREALECALNSPPEEIRPICFYLDSPDAELFCWETICNPEGKFLALGSDQWPIGRIANSPVSPSRLPHEFAPPLKIMAIISALGPTDREKSWDQAEWTRLYESIRSRRSATFPIKLQVVVGQESLVEAVTKARAQDPELLEEVRTVPESAFELRNWISNFDPHLLHFFCHGSNDSAGPRLELARITDWDQKEHSRDRRSSFTLNLDEMLTIPGINDVWLVTLNCCEGSKALRDQWSLTAALVAQGVPAAVGMLESIEPKDSHHFCGYFYDAVLTKLERAFQRMRDGQGVEVIEWTGTLCDSRNALNAPGRVAKNNQPAWTLPVIYVRRDQFQVRTAPRLAPSAAERLQAVVQGELQDLLQTFARDPKAARLLELLGVTLGQTRGGDPVSGAALTPAANGGA